ncbi:MAG: NAD(P)/FAD-dependent oxidoreductase [Brevinematales bacterium]|nr:NAD(P)/FAD-dependent oxidoreductase [Brevinematales bacterium]
MRYDYIIIGSGIVGSLLGRELVRYSFRVLMIEKGSDIGMGTSAANSAIIHAGYDPKPGTLKAKLNVRGNMLWDHLATELGIPFKKKGSYVVALVPEELPKLQELYEQGKHNGVPGLRLLSGEETREKIPGISPHACGSLFAPTAGIIDPFQANFFACENAVINGMELRLGTAFVDFLWENGAIVGIQTNAGEFRSRWVINAAGIHADEIMHKAGIHADYHIQPRRGQYVVLDRNVFSWDKVVFPCPNEQGKGILVATTMHGNTLIGPTSENVENKQALFTTEEGLKQAIEGGKRLVPNWDSRWIIAQYAGIRATLFPTKDFLIEVGEVPGFINICGIDSPGYASAPAIAEYVIEKLREKGEPLLPRHDFNPIREPRRLFKHLSPEERRRCIQKDPAYGRIVCRCEEITEGDLLAEIRGPIPARTYDALKRRTWLGTGRCQGSFDFSRVIEILARENHTSYYQVTKKGGNSRFVFSPVRGRDDL